MKSNRAARSTPLLFPPLLGLLTVSALTAQTNPVALELGKTISGELAGGQSHHYAITLSAGQYMRIVVSVPGFATVIRLSEPAGRQDQLELHLPSASQQQEPVCLIAKVSGDYRIEFAASEKAAVADKYAITLEERRPAIAGDQKQVEAQQSFERARALYEGHKYEQAIVAWDHALADARELHNRERESAALQSLGATYGSLSRYEKAVSCYEQALAIRLEIKDRSAEGHILGNIGVAGTRRRSVTLSRRWRLRKGLRTVAVKSGN